MRRALALSLALALGAARGGAGQFAPPGTGGVTALARALKQLGANKRVLVIGAHPDDEDTELLAILSRGMGVQAAYLSLSRGEGGQDLIGTQLGPELGLIRTEELLAARQLDGARQYFTRAYDFGFSKTAEETFRFWPRDSLLADVLAVIRRFRPQVLVSIFSGTPRDGHGQHQVAGLVTRQAFDVLRDSSWGPVKLYRSSWFDTAATTLRLDGGALDPLTGLSYHQIAMAGRSRHRSQDMGQLARPGPSTTRLAFVAWRNRAGAGAAGARGAGGGGARGASDGDGGGLFAGVDTLLHGTGRYAALVDSARAHLNPARPGAIVPLLARALHELQRGAATGPDEGERGDNGSGEGDALAEQRQTLAGALAAAAGVALDGVADDGIVIPGQQLQVETTVWNAGADVVRVAGVAVRAPSGWRVTPVASPDSSVAPGRIATGRCTVTVAADAPRSQPYFLRHPMSGALYDWTGVPPAWRGLPAEPPPLELAAHLTIAGEPVTLRREVAYRYRDEEIGEVRRPIFVTQPFDVAVTPDLVVWPLDGSAGGPRHFTVTVTNRARGPAATLVLLTAPPGWPALPPESLSFQREDEAKSRTVTIALPARTPPGVYTLEAAALTGGARSEGALRIIDYPHIRPRPSVHASTAEVRAARISLPTLTRVGYVRGASDRVPEALEAVGVPIVRVDADTLARGDLSRYDAIVIGSRAYETDPALVASNGRVLDYARAGGLVIVQYQQYPFFNGTFAPYRLALARPHDRVTDETAPVTALDPTSPALHVPNEIGPDDWQGWVQERGLYFAHEWDPAYTPLLEMHDPGDPPLAGGLLQAALGRGTYVYTGLAFFRELPAGVPGAYRLFANLLALKRRNVP